MSAQETVTSAAPVPVLAPEQVRDLLGTLTGQPIDVRPASPVIPGGEPAAVSVYITDGAETGAVAAWELSLATCAGAALGQVPLPEVEQSLATGCLSGDLSENFAEVANVLASAFNGAADAPDLQLHEVHGAGADLPDEVSAMLRYVVRRLDLQIDIGGYGGGRLSVVAIG